MKEKIEGTVEIPEELRELVEDGPLFIDELNRVSSQAQNHAGIQLPGMEPLPPPIDAEVTPVSGRTHLGYTPMYVFVNPFKDKPS